MCKCGPLLTFLHLTVGKSMSRVILTAFFVLSSCSYTLAEGKPSCLSATQFSHSTVTADAKGINGSVRVIWNTTAPSECVASVRVDFRTSSHGPVVATNTTNNTSQTEVIQTGLQCGIYYYVSVVVTGETSDGMHATVSSRPVQVELPGGLPVPVLMSTEATTDNTSIRVLWLWSQGLLICVDLVRVHYQPEGGSRIMYTVGNTTATSATLPNLQCNTKYNISIYARDGQANKQSHPFMVYLPARAPPTPTNITAQLTSASTVMVVWQWTSSGPAPNCFNTTTVTYRPEGGSESFLQLSDPAATETTLTGLQCNTSYTITVVATAGVHRRENMSIPKMVILPARAPPTPTEVTAQFTSASSVRVTWQWTSSGPAPDCFNTTTVTYRPEGGNESSLQLSDPAATEATLTGLQCSTNNTITVVTTAGGYKRESVMFLPPQVPPTPTNVTTQLMSASSVRVTWQWTSSDPTLDCFNTTTVIYHPEGGDESSLQLSDPTATEATLTGLQCNTSYTITVVATAGVHRRESVAFLSLQGPQSLSAAVLSPTSVYLTWVAPCHTLQYHIYYRGVCGIYTDENRLNTSHLEHIVDGLQEGINYTFTVNQSGFSGGRVFPTGPVYARTFTAVPSGAPRLLQAMFVQHTEVSFEWKEVTCVQQNGPITGYVVKYYATCGAERGVQQNKSVVTNSTIIEYLTPNTEYAFQVAAVNVNGTGPFSEPITLRGPPHPPQLVTVTPVNSTTVTLSWSEVQCFNGSGAVTHYLVQYQSMCGGAVLNVTTSDTVHETTVSGLTPNVAVYTFQVAAVGASQKVGPFSNPANTSLPGVTSMCLENSDVPPSSSYPGTQSSSDPGTQSSSDPVTQSSSDPVTQSSSDPGTQSSSDPSSGSPLDLGLVAGVAGSVVVLGLVVAVGIVVLISWWRHKQGSKKNTAVELTDMADTDSVDSKEEQDIVDNTCYMELAILPPTIVDYQREVQCSEGEQVILTVKVAGSPTPTVTWFFNGREVKDDYSTEVGKDGSLTLITVEPKHAGTYTFTVSNNVGSVEGCTKLVVRAEDEERASVSRVESNPVTREKFGEYVSSCHAQNNGGFVVQFQTLPSGEEGHQTTVDKSSENRTLNRFRNITAYDDHRVVLKSISGGVDCEHDYINATYIDGYSQGKKYIATQGPLPETVTDFWWMVWQEQIHVVAMVTNTMESGQKKCEQYWPEQGTQEYGPFKVTLTDQQVFADYTIRQLFVSCDKAGGDQLKVTQFHFTSWPDHGVPEYAGPILNYLRRIKKHSRGPTLVHCSAGVGRTGTLMAIDMALEQAARENRVDIPAIVTKMRRQRMKMVQNSDQYVFIHDAVLESLTCGDTQIPASGLTGAIEKLKQKDSETGRTGLETQFHVLGLVTPKPTEVIRATASRFPNLNRSMDFLPSDKWRVTLKGETNDYIHASFANGYKQWKGFIITQAPMKSTCRDFWKMVYERECGVIVMLSDLVENGEEVCHQYWPNGSTNGVQKYGEYSVSVLQATEQDGFIERVISITNPKSGEGHKVTQFQISCWTSEGLCTSPPAIMAVIEHVLVVQRRTGNRPIVVHGSDTVSRCGVFCSFISATECCKTEGIVDVFQVVKALRIQKPGSVLTVEQYHFIFDLMLLFLESFSIYSNFK